MSVFVHVTVGQWSPVKDMALLHVCNVIGLQLAAVDGSLQRLRASRLCSEGPFDLPKPSNYFQMAGDVWLRKALDRQLKADVQSQYVCEKCLDFCIDYL